MIPNIQDKKEAMKILWLAHQDLKAREFFRKYLGDYFDIASQSDWYFFMTFVRDWKAEENTEKRKRELLEMDGVGIADLQETNRRKMILLLRDLLMEYETNPRKFKSMNEISNWYKTIQSLEESIKRTEIQRGKLKLEAVRTLLPYQRMSLPELLELKEKFNESFDRIIKLKSGPESSGPTPADIG